MTKGRRLRDAVRGLVLSSGALGPSRPCGAPMSTPHAFALLELLQAGGPLTVGELASALSIDRTNVSRLCARLASAGEVERTTHPSDGRAVVLRLTRKGRRLARGIDQTSAQRFSIVAGELGGANGHVVEALEYLVEIMNQETP